MNGGSNRFSRRRKANGEGTSTSLKPDSYLVDSHERRRWFILRGRRRGALATTLVVLLVLVAVTRRKQLSLVAIQPADIDALVRLRRDWSSFTKLSPLAQHYKDIQSNCNLREKRNPFAKLGMGLGSELHRWTQALCESYSRNVRLRSTQRDTWTWLDQASCDATEAKEISPLYCYFPSAEGTCKTQTPVASVSVASQVSCESLQASLNLTTAHVRTAGIEFLFANVSPVVIAEAQRQLHLVFGGKPVPKNLITVHVRWGDKVTSREMKFVPIEDYIDAVKTLAKQRNHGDTVSVFLATEDPKAVQQFQQKAPSDWNVYVDQYFYEVKHHRQMDTELWNQAVATSQQTKGRAGVLTLASLLVAMEANDYVFTTASNWSRLMNELRIAILDKECNNCTRMIDLQGPHPSLQV